MLHPPSSPIRGNRLATDIPPYGYDKGVSLGLTAESGLKHVHAGLDGSEHQVSLGLTAESGLKLGAERCWFREGLVSLGLTAESGLKPGLEDRASQSRSVSLGLTAESGLKLSNRTPDARGSWFLSASPPRAD